MPDKFKIKEVIACSTKKTVCLTVVLVLFIFVKVSFGKDVFSELDFIKPKIRVEAPAFTLKDLDGIAKKLQNLKGKLILLNFWATWCHYCRDEMPEMEMLWEKFKNKDFVIIAVSADKNTRMVREFCQTHDITFTILLDPKGKVRKMYEVTLLPMTYIIGRDGKITGRLIGARKWSSGVVEKFINTIIK